MTRAVAIAVLLAASCGKGKNKNKNENKADAGAGVPVAVDRPNQSVAVALPTGPAPDRCADGCEEACERGDVEQCSLAAETYFYGRAGRSFDLKQALGFARKACDGGAAQGCTMLGLHYQDGLATEWDPPKAVATYEKGCAAGAGTSCYNLATMYAGGHGINADPERADKLIAEAGRKWRASCEGDEPRWCTNAAYVLGPTETAKKIDLNRRACEHHLPIGCTLLAELRHDAGEIDEPTLFRALDELCDRSEEHACRRLADRLATKRPGRAEAARIRACELGQADSCVALAKSLGGKSPAAEARYLAQACARAHGDACLILAEKQLKRGDRDGAKQASRRACHMGKGFGCALHAKMMIKPDGSPDIEKVARWATEACRMGDSSSCALLVSTGRELPVAPVHRKPMLEKMCEANVPRSCEALGTP